MNLKHYYLGECYFDENHFLDSIGEFEKQIEIYPIRECYAYIGIAYARLGCFEESFHWSEKALDPTLPSSSGPSGSYPGYYYNLGAIHFMAGNNQESVDWYNKGLKISGQEFSHDYNWGVSLPLLKELYTGLNSVRSDAWRCYNSRFFHSGEKTVIDTSIKLWTGEPTQKREILVQTEQGLGDRIQFGRYIHLLKSKFDKVWVSAPEELETFYSDFNYVSCPEFSSADLTVPLLDLANIFYEDQVPAGWLKNKYTSYNSYRKNKKPNIIIEWAGNNHHNQNGFRNCDPEYFKPLTGLANLYNIRPGAVGPDWITYLNSNNWQESAEYVNGCDLVISIDTSLVHLAGSLGKTCWMLEPWAGRCWRWGNQLLGEQNWWYPTVKVIRNHRDWKGVFENVLNKLESKTDA